MCPWSSSQCHQHSGHTLRDELSCPRKAEAQKMSSGRKVVFLQAAVDGFGSQLSWLCVLGTNKLLRLIPLQRERERAVPGELQRC